MIVSNKAYLVVGRVARIEAFSFRCQIVTCPEKLVSRWTTCVFVDVGGKKRLIARARHSNVLTKDQHKKLHEALAQRIDALGSSIASKIGDAVIRAFLDARERNLVTEIAKAPDLEFANP